MYICNDSFGSRINVGDKVELMMGYEMKTPWTSTVYWNMIDGAFVDGHPGHRKMGIGIHRNLREFLNRETITDFEGDPIKIYCKKVKK